MTRSRLENDPAAVGALRVERLRKHLGGFVLNADFEVAAGERAALLGRSGSGKTTLLRILAGLESLDGPGDQGCVRVGGEDVTRLSPESRHMGVVFQEPALFPTLTVLENAAFGLRMRGIGRDEREAAALPWLERVGLQAFAHQSVTRLSGGERQRVAFVRAIVWKPKVLLLDEPFSALDTAMRGALRRELVELHRLWPVPLMLVTHDEADVVAIATTRIDYSERDAGQSRTFTKTPPEAFQPTS